MFATLYRGPSRPGFTMTASALGALAVAAISLGGCATEKYVNERVAVVDAKVDAKAQENKAQFNSVDARLQAHDAKLAEIDKTSRDALERAQAAGKLAEGKFVYSMVLSDDTVKFPVNRAALSPAERQSLAAFVEKLKTDNRNVYVEIQGHTDARGSAEANLRLGEQRAEAVRRYLNRAGVALNRMATISYGKEEPAAPNKTRAGRAQNRRVVLVVLA